MARPSSTWLPRFLFRLTWALSVVFLLTVLVAPGLDRGAEVHGAARVLRLFAHDATLRRTTVASALGLMVTACIFFRSPEVPRRVPSKQSKMPPPNVTGA
jgi:hypothetical protein